MNLITRIKFLPVIIFAVFAVLALVSVQQLTAGGVKTGGDYEILADSLTAAGSAGILSDSTYWLIYSAAESPGTGTLENGTYMLEGGFVSGINAIFKITKTVYQVDVPAGYTGNADDIVPGAMITYQLLFENYGEAAYDTVIREEIPTAELEFADEQYASDTIQLVLNDTVATKTPAADSDDCEEVDTATIECIIENIDAGATGALFIKTIIK